MIKSLIATTLVTGLATIALPVAAAVGQITAPAIRSESVAAAPARGSGADHVAQVQSAPRAAEVPTSAESAGSSSGSQTISVTIPPRAQPAEPACPVPSAGDTGPAPAAVAADGAITGTTNADLAEFAQRFNDIRVENCLDPVPFANFRYDECMETRLIWMAEDPSTDPASAWGHEGSFRSDGVPSIGCDGNLAGGSDNTGATVAQKWWDSPSHRASLYRPDIPSDVENACVIFAMTHGGVPNEPSTFVRAAARWISC